MIREIEKNDYEQVYIIGESFQSNFRNIYDLEELSKNDYFHLLVYIENSLVIGFLMYTNLYETVDILDIVTETSHRNQKVATNLIDYMITSLTPNTIIYLEVATDNTHAISLYEKFGFKTIHTRKQYYGLKDAYIMERRLENE